MIQSEDCTGVPYNCCGNLYICIHSVIVNPPLETWDRRPN